MISHSHRLAKLLLLAAIWSLASQACLAQPVRFATFNVSLYANGAGEVQQRLSGTDDPQAAVLAEIIQRFRPDVLLLNEVDYDPNGTLVDQFQENYLAIGQNVSESPEGPAQPVKYPYRYLGPSNTGVHSGADLDHNGQIDPNPGSNAHGADCWGYGRYPGQYGMVVLSRYPIDTAAVRTFRTFLWKDMPAARLPDDPSTEAPDDWYSAAVLEQFPLSSKSHWDVPIDVDGHTIHVLASHPTPPTFDGPEDRNGRRNHDEIRFWVDYIADPQQSEYIYDDNGRHGGLRPRASFVVMGDLNGDPQDGQGKEGIARLLASPRVAPVPIPESDGGQQQSSLQEGANEAHQGNPRHDTLDASDNPGPGNLRLDYVLPSKNLKSVASAVFWPKDDEATFRLVGTHPFPSSDHRLVWVDLSWEDTAK